MNALSLTLTFALPLRVQTIQGFPYYAIKDRVHLYTVGSVVYGLYFVVSFPMFARLDEPVDASASGALLQPTPPRSVVPQTPPSGGKGRAQDTDGGVVQVAGGSDSPFSGWGGGSLSDSGGTSSVWSLERTVVDALAACMTVTLLLDFWRLAYEAAGQTQASAGLGDASRSGMPWFHPPP
jgi:hypothetical protein